MFPFSWAFQWVAFSCFMFFSELSHFSSLAKTTLKFIHINFHANKILYNSAHIIRWLCAERLFAYAWILCTFGTIQFSTIWFIWLARMHDIYSQLKQCLCFVCACVVCECKKLHPSNWCYSFVLAITANKMFLLHCYEVVMRKNKISQRNYAIFRQPNPT